MSDIARIARRRLLALAAAAPLVAALPPAPPDPVAAACAELVAASLACERAEAEAGVGAGLLPFVRRVVALRDRLAAEHGEDLGPALWRAAMQRHRRWQVARYGLPDDA